jgi:hypothetical protein
MRAIHGEGDAYVAFLNELHDEEVRSGRPFLPDPQRVLSLVGPAFRDDGVLRYLERGLVAKSYMGFAICRCCARADGAMGTCDLTDGEWVWPQGLAHYVREHSLPLPTRFRECISANGVRPAPEARAHASEHWDAPYDVTFWHAWAEAVYGGKPEP